jgi:hypothetical protein
MDDPRDSRIAHRNRTQLASLRERRVRFGSSSAGSQKDDPNTDLPPRRIGMCERQVSLQAPEASVGKFVPDSGPLVTRVQNRRCLEVGLCLCSLTRGYRVDSLPEGACGHLWLIFFALPERVPVV